jgi:PAS domain S-box-containing protein
MALQLDSGTLEAVIDVAPTPLWVIESDGTVALANRAAVSMLGYKSVDDVIGAPSHDTLHEWHPDGSRYHSDSCPIMGPGRCEAAPTEWFLTRAGQPIPVTWSTRPIGVGGARLLSFVDATERLAEQRDLLAVSVASRAELRASLLTHVRTRYRDPDFTPTVLAAEVHLSLRAVQQLFAEEGRSPATEIRRRRLELAEALLGRGASVNDACRASGFSDPGTFTRAFRRHFGHSPSVARSVR